MTTRDEILAMAREAGFQNVQDHPVISECVERLVRLAQAGAYERAAVVCAAIAADRWDRYKGRGEYQGQNNPYRADSITQGENIGAEACEEAVRCLKEQA